MRKKRNKRWLKEKKKKKKEKKRNQSAFIRVFPRASMPNDVV